MERRENWYSVIQYCPNKLRGEIVNVGLLMHDVKKGKLKYKILEESNLKLKSIIPDEVSNVVYRTSRDVVDFLLENLPENDTILESGVYNHSFLPDIVKDFPENFILSKPSYSMTRDPDMLFEKLFINYIGKEFLDTTAGVNEVSTKEYISDYFKTHHLLGTKIKTNARINPIKNISNMHYIIDFVYKNGQINLMQSVPSNQARLNDWFSKMHTISKSYDNEGEIYLIYKGDEEQHNDDTLIDMFSYLKKEDGRVKTIEVDSTEFIDLGNKIKDEGRYVEEFEAELA